MTEPYGLYQEKTDPSVKREIPESRDSMLFLVVFDSALISEPDTSCWHVIGLGDGSRGFCQNGASHVCPCCGFSTCETHQSEKVASFVDADGVLSEETAQLCMNCSLLTQEKRYTLHAFRLAMND
jgi:hypothetical protein